MMVTMMMKHSPHIPPFVLTVGNLLLLLSRCWYTRNWPAQRGAGRQHARYWPRGNLGVVEVVLAWNRRVVLYTFYTVKQAQMDYKLLKMGWIKIVWQLPLTLTDYVLSTYKLTKLSLLSHFCNWKHLEANTEKYCSLFINKCELFWLVCVSLSNSRYSQ